MKRFLLFFALVLASAFTYCWRMVDEAAFHVARVYRRAHEWVIDRVASFANGGGSGGIDRDVSPISIRAAKLYQLRQIKRERPVTSPTWRMCPSG